MFRLKEWIHDYNHDMCGMMSYTISDKKFVTDNIRVRLVPYSTHTYSYLYPRTSVFVFVSEAIRIRIRIRIKIWKQIWFQWYPSVFDPITSLTVGIHDKKFRGKIKYNLPSAKEYIQQNITLPSVFKEALGKEFFLQN